MFFIISALNFEAKPLINYFKLKKEPQNNRMQIFSSSKIKLIISGIGKMNSAIATTHLLTLYNATKTDVIFNIGICGAIHKKFKLGTPILCNKIIDKSIKKKFYPDILIKHSLFEGSLQTFSGPVTRHMLNLVETDLVDLEAAGFYEAASVFLPHHNIYCIKIVSDYLEPETVKPNLVTQYIENNLHRFEELMCKSEAINNKMNPILSPKDHEILEKMIGNLCLTSTMSSQLYKMAKQYKVLYKKNINFLERYKNVKVKTKNERDVYFERIKRQLLSK